VLTSGQADGSSRPFEETDFQPVVHQAAGMISVYHGFGIDDAEALLRAHSFAEDRPVTDVARDVVQRRTRLS
jgi:AmiR/NasT family two-component response regulator